MEDIKVVIDAGHGGTDSGAVANGVREKDLTLDISKYMYDKFTSLGIPATLVRSTDETVTPSERVNRILNAYGNNPNVVVISNHINSNATPNSAQGAEVIYALRNDSTLASNILENLGEAGQKMRTIYQRRSTTDPSKDYYFIHRQTGNTQPVIVEYGFINNQEDLNRIRTNYKSYANAVVDAVIDTFNIKTYDTNSSNTYVVQKGDTLWDIARRYNITVDELKRLNGLTNNILSIGQILKIPMENSDQSNNMNSDEENNLNNLYINYTVRYGDTLWKISRIYDTTVEDIMRLNNMTSNFLSVGQVIKVPVNTSTRTYTVRYGDTLWSIAKRYNTTVEEIKRLNNLTNNIISIGQILRIS